MDLLLECHERIRRFLVLARDIAHARGADPQEIRSAAAQVRRYFAESLPLHVADEQQEVLPRLASTSAEIDQALTAMTDDHGAHEPLVARLIDACDQLTHDPERLDAIAAELASHVADLTAALHHHLELEERVIFPAVRRLPSGQRADIASAMRERRSYKSANASAPAATDATTSTTPIVRK